MIIKTRNLNENFWGQSTKWRNTMRSWWKINNRTKCEIQKFLLAHTNKLFFPASRVSKKLRIRYKNNYKISRGIEEVAFSILAGLLCHNEAWLGRTEALSLDEVHILKQYFQTFLNTITMDLHFPLILLRDSMQLIVQKLILLPCLLSRSFMIHFFWRLSGVCGRYTYNCCKQRLPSLVHLRQENHWFRLYKFSTVQPRFRKYIDMELFDKSWRLRLRYSPICHWIWWAKKQMGLACRRL